MVSIRRKICSGSGVCLSDHLAQNLCAFAVKNSVFKWLCHPRFLLNKSYEIMKNPMLISIRRNPIGIERYLNLPQSVTR